MGLLIGAGAVLAPGSAVGAADHHRSVSIVVTQRGGARLMRAGFVGVSLDDDQMRMFAHTPGFDDVLADLNPTREPFMLRVGGLSADRTIWAGSLSEVPAADRLADVRIIGPAWMRTLARLASQSHSRVVLSVSAVAHSPRGAEAEITAAHSALGARLSGAAIGNEPDQYRDGLLGANGMEMPWVFKYGPGAYAREFANYATAIRTVDPALPLLGPETANPFPAWQAPLLDSEASVLSTHVYPLDGCFPVGSERYPTIRKYLSDELVARWTARVAPLAAAAVRAGKPFRVTELGASACLPVAGVTDTVATGLWAADQLMALASIGVAGVNVNLSAHQPASALSLTSIDRLRSTPMLDAVILVARTIGGGGRLTMLTPTGTPHLHIWTVAGRRHIRLLAVNTAARPRALRVRMSGHGAGAVQQFTGSSPASPHASLNGQQLGSLGGWYGRQRLRVVAERDRRWDLTVPADSADMMTVKTRPSQRRPSRESATQRSRSRHR